MNFCCCFWRTAFVLAAVLSGLLIVTVVEAEKSTVELQANNLTFTCTRIVAATDGGEKLHNVVLLHGFPYNRNWYGSLLDSWDGNGNNTINAIACDLRGVSPGASPDDVSAYGYDILASDVYALADAAGYNDNGNSGFHLVGADHGGGVGWVAASEKHNGNGQILSYTSINVPHLDSFAAALCSDDEDNSVDDDQVLASQYFNQLSLPDSATINNASLVNFFAAIGFQSEPDVLQKHLWWYTGAVDAGYFALPRIYNDTEIPADQAFVLGVRQAIPLDTRPCQQASTSIGTLDLPILFVCGANDPFLLCTKPWAIDISLMPNMQYFLAESCGHDPLLEGECENPQDKEDTIATMTDFITGYEYSETKDDETMDGTSSGSQARWKRQFALTFASFWFALLTV